MKADKDLTVEYELSEELETVVVSFADGSMTETSLEQDLRRIQRAAFEKGAKAQREADVQEAINYENGTSGCADWYAACGDIRDLLVAKPLVEFKEGEG